LNDEPGIVLSGYFLYGRPAKVSLGGSVTGKRSLLIDINVWENILSLQGYGIAAMGPIDQAKSCAL
jgi:hypothetical protein